MANEDDQAFNHRSHKVTAFLEAVSKVPDNDGGPLIGDPQLVSLPVTWEDEIDLTGIDFSKLVNLSSSVVEVFPDD